MKKAPAVLKAKTLNRLAARINQAHSGLMLKAKQTLEGAVTIGGWLVEAKSQCKNGDWLLWFEANIQFSQQTASRYANCWKSRDQLLNVSNLSSLSDAYRLLGGGAGAHVANNSGDNEWYTPKPYIRAARNVMGGIDLDPASSKEANRVVGAREFYSEQDNGLEKPWRGRVWLNPPYASHLIGKFVEKLCESRRSKAVVQAAVLVNNATETAWFQAAAGIASAICFPEGRVKFWHPTKESIPLQGQALMYIGPNTSAFLKEFKAFGLVMRP